MQILGIFTSCKPISAISNNEVNFSEDKTLTLRGRKENGRKWMDFFFFTRGLVVVFFLFLFFKRDNVCTYSRNLLNSQQRERPFILLNDLFCSAIWFKRF